MIRRLSPLALLAVILVAGCVTNSTPQFAGEQVSMQRASQANVALGIKYMQAGDRDTAMQMIQKAIEQDPDNADAYAAEALLYSTTGDPERAEDAYQKALHKGPGDPEIENNYAVFLCQRGKPKDAVQYFLKSAANPRYATPDAAYSNAGVCALRIPDEKDAEQYFRKSLQVNPSFPDALYQMAELTYKQQKYLEARAFIERYNQVAQPRPEVLLLGVRTERALGDQQGAADYAKQLLKLFPTSPEVQQLTQAGPHGR